MGLRRARYSPGDDRRERSGRSGHVLRRCRLPRRRKRAGKLPSCRPKRTINGKTPEQRLAVRREKSRPLVIDLETWMRRQRALLSSGNETAKAINYLLNRWAAFTRFLDDGRVCLSNNAAERALRGVAVGRKNWTFAGSDVCGHPPAPVYTPIE